MPIFYDRKENQNEVIIRFKYHTASYILLLAGFIIAYTGPYIGMKESTGIMIVIGILLLITVYSLAIRGQSKAIRKAMKSGSVELSGSKFSFSNPLTYRIKK